MAFSILNGVTIHYKTEGSAANPALVFANSLGSDLQIWDELVPHFSDRYFIIRYDKRGHGLSDSPAGPYSISDHSEDFARLLAHLGVNQTTIVGISIGGLIALDFASRRPQQVTALILCDTAAKIGTADYWQERISLIREKGMAQMAEVILSRWFAPSFSTDDKAVYQGGYNMLTRTPLEGYIASCEGIAGADLRDAVPLIETPSLVLCGSEDAATPPELVRGLAEALPHSQFALIDGAGHTPCLERPESMAARMKEFLRTGANG